MRYRCTFARLPLRLQVGLDEPQPLVDAARHLGEQVDQANELGDLDTADLFTEVSRGIDKWLWFVEAHLQAER